MGHVARLVGVVVASRGDHEAVSDMTELDEPEPHSQKNPGPQQGDDLEGHDFTRDRNAEIVDEVLDQGYEMLETFHVGSGEKTS